MHYKYANALSIFILKLWKLTLWTEGWSRPSLFEGWRPSLLLLSLLLSFLLVQTSASGTDPTPNNKGWDKKLLCWQCPILLWFFMVVLARPAFQCLLQAKILEYFKSFLNVHRSGLGCENSLQLPKKIIIVDENPESLPQQFQSSFRNFFENYFRPFPFFTVLAGMLVKWEGGCAIHFLEILNQQL